MILEVENLSVHYENKTAVKELSFQVEKGRSLGVIGESGSGKTTLGFSLIRLISRSYIGEKSRIFFKGKDILKMPYRDFKPLRSKIQMVFQDPFSSFNPRLKIGKALEEGLLIHKMGSEEVRQEKVLEMLELAGLNRGALDKYPHEFSGGQRQRLALARALVLEPEMVIADEPVSSLDVSVQAQILNLMKDLKKKFSLTYIFIAHDLGTVDYFCDSLLVMYQGEMMETGDKSILKDPFHPYTRLLLNSLPGVRKNPEPPLSKVHFDSKCPFFERCPVRYDKCAGYTGRYYTLSPGHQTTCVRGEK